MPGESRNQFSFTFALTIGILTLTSRSQAQILFSDNFNSGASALWDNARGNWIAVGGVYNAQSPSNDPLIFSGLPFSLTDFTVDVDINKVGDGGLWLRTDTSGKSGVLLVTGGYLWGYPGHGSNPEAGKALYWHVVTDGDPGPVLNPVLDVFTNPGIEDVHIRVTVVGDTYSAYVNGSSTPTGTLIDNTYTSGRVGLYDFSEQTFDNFVLSDAFGVPPIILSQPLSLTAQVGASASFTVMATGAPPLSYQWRKDGINIPGGTGATLAINSVGIAHAGAYSVVVSSPYGSVTSGSAQLTTTQPLILTQTSLVPTTAQTTPAVVFPTSAQQLKAFVNGGFAANATLDPGRMTIVLTHGWIPSIGWHGLTDGINGWPKDMAQVLSTNGFGANANIVAWDWGSAAKSFICDPAAAARHTPVQGQGLMQALRAALGGSYNGRIHFVGHSLGTLVNATAANYLHANGFLASNTHLTLFDEAELATDVKNCRQLLQLALDTTPSSSPNYIQPLPKQFAWADNYVSLVGFLHQQAANVILTNGLPEAAATIDDLIRKAVDFHGYPCSWYGDTIANPSGALMGFRWAFENGGFSGAPAPGTVYVQAFADSDLDLVQKSYSEGLDLLKEHWTKYQAATQTAAQSIASGLRGGQVSGQLLVAGPFNAWDMIVNLQTTSTSSQMSPQGGPRPQDGGGGSTNLAAYTWIPILVPSNAVSMSFDFMLQGDAKADWFAAALNDTNVLSVVADLIQTNVTLNSGLIDVWHYSGQQVELFLGIVGGTSSNAIVTVSSLRFYGSVAPSLKSELAGTNFITSWPVWAGDYLLEATTNLNAPVGWITVTNVPSVVDLQSTLTNTLSGASRFYRLRKQ